MVNQPELELQLKVWKELAISKQMLMRAATDALKLDPNCSTDELKQALEAVIKKTAKAEADLAQSQAEARQAALAAEKKIATTERELAAAQATIAELQKTQDAATKQMAIDRTAAAKDQQKLKERLDEKEKALKAINTALADTPENVLKKMNQLKKQRQDEADARRQVETAHNSLRADKQKQEQKTAEVQKSSGKLATQFRDLHALASKLHEQLKAEAKDAKGLPKVPELDTKLLDEVEQLAANGSGSKK
jgi:chromosome segregation ATPase